MIVAVVALALLSALLGGGLVLLVPWGRKILASEQRALNTASDERELREDLEDERDQWRAEHAKAVAEKEDAHDSIRKLAKQLSASREAFLAYLEKTQSARTPSEAIALMDDLIARKLES